MRHGATDAEIQRVVAVIEELGYKAQPMPGAQRTAVGLVGNDGRVDASRLEALPGVQEIIHVSRPYKQVSREWKSENTIVRLPGGVAVGGTEVVAIARPCSVESEGQILEAARQVREAGAVILRGGAWKPRTSPYAFQGLRRPGLKLLARARGESGLLTCTQATASEGVGYVAAVAAGADGIIVEVHPHPDQALSDGAQSLFPDQFAQLMREVRVIAEVIGRRVAEPASVGA